MLLEFGINSLVYFNYAILIALFCIIYLLERRKFHLRMGSPIACLMGPIIFVSFLVQFVTYRLGFVELSTGAINIWIYGMLAFWSGGLLVIIFNRKKCTTKAALRIQSAYKHRRTLDIICFLMIIISFLDLIASVQNVGFAGLSKGDFASHGLVGHINNFIMGFCIYYAVSLKNKIYSSRKLAYIYIVVIVLLKLMTGIRGNIILPILGIFIVFLMYNYLILNVKISASVIIGILLLFIGTTFIFQAENTEKDYLLHYVCFYIIAGVAGLSSYMDTYNPIMGFNKDFIFSFYNNLAIKLSGESKIYDSIIQDNWSSIVDGTSIFSFATNTYTLIGEVFINQGYFIAICYFIILGIVSYMLFLNAYKSVFMTVAYGWVAACLSLGMFSQYTLGIFFHTTTLLFIILHYIFSVHHEASCGSNSI